MRIKHEFVESFPEPLAEGTLYVSMRYRTAAHLCACGCGRKVITPIRKEAWILKFDGESITLFPSIGSRNLACRSHYYIWDGEVMWLKKMGDLSKTNAWDVTSTQDETAPVRISKSRLERLRRCFLLWNRK